MIKNSSGIFLGEFIALPLGESIQSLAIIIHARLTFFLRVTYFFVITFETIIDIYANIINSISDKHCSSKQIFVKF